ncbi:MAG: hypothetical protein QCH35_04125 [Methanomicrobiaceae archaeon]|nr:hypothetical protein [Methanomicrobiaceae archaeon]
MTKFYMRWHMNPMTIPTNPEERGKLWISMLEMVREELNSGGFTDWGICSDLSAGYAFAETDEKSLHASILKWIPYIVFDIKPVLTVDQSIENVKKAEEAVKK